MLAALAASLRGELAESRAALARAVEELAAARERIAELEARLRQTPRNSSEPPSSRGPGKPPPPPWSLRKKTGREPGGQDGHQGSTLAQVTRPDRELRHEPGCCGRCGAGRAGRPVTGVKRRQVFDLPEVTIKVAELFGIPLSSGTVAAITARAAGRLDSFPERVRDNIAAAEVAGCDETGFRVDGRLAWVHCARTGKYTLLTVHPKRGTEAIKAMGVLPWFTRVAVHDAWAPVRHLYES